MTIWATIRTADRKPRTISNFFMGRTDLVRDRWEAARQPP